MELKLNSSEFERQDTNSVYNHNYYKHKHFGYIILEICHEDENYYEFNLIHEDKSVFIGCAPIGLNDILILTIDFMNPYT